MGSSRAASVDYGVFEHSPSTEDLEEALSSHMQWEGLLSEIGGTALLAGQDELYILWQKLRNDEPELMEIFQNFLRKSVREIEKMNDKCDDVVKSKNGVHTDEMRKLYEEMDHLLMTERELLRRKYEEEMQLELDRQLEMRQQEMHDLVTRKKELEVSLRELNKREKEVSQQNNQLEQMVFELSRHESNIVTQNEFLIKENSALKTRLDQSLAGLNETQQLCLQLQDETEREREYFQREYEEVVIEHENKLRDRQHLELQLEKLREKYESLVEDNYHKKSEPKKVGVMQMSRVSSFSDCECDQQLQVRYIQYFLTTEYLDLCLFFRFRSIPHAYFRKADGVLLLYDIACIKSFMNVKGWIAHIRDVDENAILMIVGNKDDLAPKYRDVDTEAAIKLAEENDAFFIEASAKTGNNIFEAFGKLAREIQIREDDNVSRVYTSLVDLNQELPYMKKSKCCRN
ncbi:uncharacterized protein LOC117118166 [Anneissia japonica]|uniref:uncharacterized protein LOC117118166 n=1 Tax=Anneissia japonica TaxID=1529436 RepID=UPI0014256BCE|nr:uncharacterized protein LOC117118166 [Anneissia japonica]